MNQTELPNADILRTNYRGALEMRNENSMTQWQTADGKTPVIAVLGATGGIGEALCRRLSSCGAEMVLGARSETPLKKLAGELCAVGQSVDVTQSEQVDAWFAQAMEHSGRLDGAVCCVGSLLLKPAHLTSDVDWHDTLAQNMTSAFYVLRAAVRVMKSGGSIVLCSSAAARTGLANHEAIGAAKAGVIGLTLSAAATYARQNIRVNCVAPGLVRTRLTQSLTGNEAMAKASTALHPLGRLGEPDDVASAIAWLLDPAQTWVTGQIIGVDGGLASIRSR